MSFVEREVPNKQGINQPIKRYTRSYTYIRSVYYTLEYTELVSFKVYFKR